MLHVEAPSERDDGRWYTALLLRDEDWVSFGVVEFFDEEANRTKRQLRQLADRVVLDAGLRRSLLSRSAKARSMWRRR